MNINLFKLDKADFESNFYTGITYDQHNAGRQFFDSFKEKENALEFFKENLHNQSIGSVICALQCMPSVNFEFIYCALRLKGTTLVEMGEPFGKTLLVDTLSKATKMYKKISRSERHPELLKNMIAASDATERMIALGANVNTGHVEKDFTTLLDIALSANCTPMIRMLISKGAKAYAFSESTTRSLAAQETLDIAFKPLLKRIMLLPLVGNGNLLPELINTISTLLLKSCCQATFVFPEESFQP